MATCVMCGKKGLFLRVNEYRICKDCAESKVKLAVSIDKESHGLRGKHRTETIFIKNIHKHVPEMRALIHDIEISGVPAYQGEWYTIESYVSRTKVYGSANRKDWYHIGNIDRDDAPLIRAQLAEGAIDKLGVKHSGEHAYNATGYNAFLQFYNKNTHK